MKLRHPLGDAGELGLARRTISVWGPHGRIPRCNASRVDEGCDGRNRGLCDSKVVSMSFDASVEPKGTRQNQASKEVDLRR